MSAENMETEQKKFERRFGTRDEVWNGQAEKTRGGLTKDKLMLSRTGRLVSKLKSEQAKQNYAKYGFAKRVVEEKKPKAKRKVKRKKKQKKLEE